MIAILCLLGFLIPRFSFMPLDQCERWHSEEVSARPDWIESKGVQVVVLVDTATLGDYLFKGHGVCDRGKVMVKRTIKHELFNWEYEEESDFEDSLYFEELLLVSGTDTTILDSCHYGYDHIEVSVDSSTFAAFKIRSLGEEHCRGDIVLYDSVNLRGLTIFALASCTLIRFSPDGQFVAFSDLGDLYVSEVDYPAAERVLHEGGSYWLGGCLDYSFNSELLEWSPDNPILFFEYSIGHRAKTIKRFIIR